MGLFEGLDAEKYDRQYKDSDLLKRIFAYFKPERSRLLVVVICSILISLLSASSTLIISRAVDLIVADASLQNIILICGLAFGIGVLIWGINYINQYTTVKAVANVLVKLAGDSFNASVHHDLSFFDEYSTGRIVSRITTDTQDFGQLVQIVTHVGSHVLEAVVLGVILARIDWRLFLWILGMLPVVFFFGWLFRYYARKITQKGMRATANVNATIKETISGIAVAKNFRQEQTIFNDFDQANRKSYDVNWRRGFVLSTVFPILNGIGAIATAILLYAGGLSAVKGLITAGAWYLFILSLDRFMFPILNLTSFWATIQNGLSAAERVFALIDTKTKVVQTGQVKPEPLVGKIDFDHVYFSYKENESVLEDFSLHIKPGENLALVGHTGAGKSSVAKLIERFYEFQGGQIRIDDQDIRSFDLQEYRKQLGIVTQIPFLFSGSVLENIRYAKPEASESEVIALAGKIGNGEWLETLPQGLATEVGERGSQLSLGQRQLVSLMRVLVQKPAIFILDEATASVDPFTEWQIQQALDLILQQSTSILIAHRLSTVKSADRIIVLENGKVIEEGNHERLLLGGGHYSVLYNTYFRHQSLDYIENSRKNLETGPLSSGV